MREKGRAWRSLEREMKKWNHDRTTHVPTEAVTKEENFVTENYRYWKGKVRDRCHLWNFIEERQNKFRNCSIKCLQM